MEPTKSLLFICHGNIIRSPLAEHLFLHLGAQAGLEGRYQADSAGTSSEELGNPPDIRMLRIAAAHGLDYSGRARRVTQTDLDRFDLILAMDRRNQRDLLALAGSPEQRAKIRLMRQFDSQGEGDLDVPDPWYDGHAEFENVYTIIERSVRGLWEALQQGEV
jgi:protein-tyrosine phosphatase